MFDRIGTFVVHHARAVLLATVLFLAGAAVLGVGAFDKLGTGGFEDPASESATASALVESSFGGQTDLVFLVEARTGTVDGPQATAAGSRLAERLAAEPGVGTVVSYWSAHAPPLRSPDGRYALVLADAGEAGDELAAKYREDTADVSIRYGGAVGAGADINEQVARDLLLAEAIAVPLILLLLVFAFRSVTAALLPLAIGTIAIFGTFAELSLLGSVTDVSIYAVNLTTALGLGLAIDYALLMVSRFREELAGGADPRQAVVRTVATAGRTVVFSAATVAAALAVMLIFPLYFLRSFAYAGIGVVAVSALGALLVLPAMLAVLGHRVNAGRLPWLRPAGAEAPVWGRLAGLVMRRPVLTALPVVAALLVAALPLLRVDFGTPDDRVLPTSASSRQVGDVLRTEFDSDATTALQLVTTGPVAAAPLGEYAARLSALPAVARVESSAGTFRDGQPAGTSPADAALGRPGAQRLSVVTEADAHSQQAQDLVREVRATPAPVGVLVGGVSASLVDSKHAIGSRLWLAGALIVLTTFVLLFLFTGSVLQPLRSLLLNALTLGATLGAMVFVFQQGHLSSLLGHTALPLNTSMLVLLFCIAFGLSMDYEVFVLSRIKELHDAGADDRTAVVQGLARSGRIVSTAAVLLAVSFFAFGTAQVSFLQLFGIGAGLAVLIDATLVRGVLVPACMRVLGRYAWYSPRPLRLLHRRVALAEAH